MNQEQWDDFYRKVSEARGYFRGRYGKKSYSEVVSLLGIVEFTIYQDGKPRKDFQFPISPEFPSLDELDDMISE